MSRRGEAGPTARPSSPAPGAAQLVLVRRMLLALGGHFGVADPAVGATGEDDGAAGPLPTLEWARLDADGLRRAATEVQKVISALEHQQRRLLGTIEAQGAFRADGALNAADWAAQKLGVGRGKANDAVRTAQELEKLPHLAEVATAGEVTGDQLKPLAEMADTGTDAMLAEEGPKQPVSVLQRQAAKKRRPSSSDERSARAARHFTHWTDGHELRFKGSLPTAEGQKLVQAVERSMPPRDTTAEVPDTFAQRRADGLAALARQTLATDPDPDRATLVVFAELAAICDDDPAAIAELEASQPLATETARRLLCDGRIQPIVQDRTGRAVGVGTTQRVVSPAMRRAVMARDRGCRFGQCESQLFLEAHHVERWPSPTTMGNLVMLCDRHHHAVHEGGWTLSGDPACELLATSPAGVVLRSHPRHRPPPQLARLDRGDPAAGSPPVASTIGSSVDSSGGSPVALAPPRPAEVVERSSPPGEPDDARPSGPIRRGATRSRRPGTAAGVVPRPLFPDSG